METFQRNEKLLLCFNYQIISFLYLSQTNAWGRGYNFAFVLLLVIKKHTYCRLRKTRLAVQLWFCFSVIELFDFFKFRFQCDLFIIITVIYRWKIYKIKSKCVHSMMVMSNKYNWCLCEVGLWLVSDHSILRRRFFHGSLELVGRNNRHVFKIGLSMNVL